MKVAFLFPGQGVTIDREGVAWYRSSEAVRRLAGLAAAHAGSSPSRIFATNVRGIMPVELLEPVHTALCLGIHEELVRRRVRADIVTGHSLGEVAACAAAGACSPEGAIALAAERGRLMAREAARRPGGMLSLRGVSRETMEAAVAVASERGKAGLAAHNAPDEWVVSGEWPALRRLAARYAALPVPVSGAWHSAMLAGAVDEFRAAARRVLSSPLRIPLVSNRTGLVVGPGEELSDLLALQLTQPVEWTQVMSTVAACGVTDVVTIGPSRVLRALVRLNLGDRVRVHRTETVEESEQVVGVLTR